MIKALHPDQYLSTVYGRGLHVVLLHRGDELAKKAAYNLASVEPYIHGLQPMSLWACFIETKEHTELVQVVMLPQFRFFLNGREVGGRVGVISSEEIVKALRDIEDHK